MITITLGASKTSLSFRRGGCSVSFVREETENTKQIMLGAGIGFAPLNAMLIASAGRGNDQLRGIGLSFLPAKKLSYYRFGWSPRS